MIAKPWVDGRAPRLSSAQPSASDYGPRTLRRRLIAASLALAAIAALAPAQGAEPARDAPADCASVTASTRLQAVGYAHVVTLANHCSRAVSCEVWTNVDPTPHLTLNAKPGETAETITRAGSPSRDVHAEKLCHFSQT